MKTRTILLHLFIDVFIGGLASFGFVWFLEYSFDWRGMGAVFFVVGVLFLWAGFLRGNSVPTYPALKTVILLLPFCIVSFHLFPNRLQLAIDVAIGFSTAIAGIYARRSWQTGRYIRTLFASGAALIFLEIINLLVAPVLAEKMFTRSLDVPAPPVSFTRLNGERIESSQLRRTVTVLYFWATWCPPCWQEFPKVEELYERYASNPNVAFLAISGVENGETAETAKSFIQDHGYRIPAAWDDRRAWVTMRTRVFPCLLIFDREWHLRLVHAGYDGSEHYVANMSRAIDTLLREAQLQYGSGDHVQLNNVTNDGNIPHRARAGR